jgi:hypothetical protein
MLDLGNILMSFLLDPQRVGCRENYSLHQTQVLFIRLCLHKLVVSLGRS